MTVLNKMQNRNPRFSLNYIRNTFALNQNNTHKNFSFFKEILINVLKITSSTVVLNKGFHFVESTHIFYKIDNGLPLITKIII